MKESNKIYKKRVLGRGLSSLIPEYKEERDRVIECPIDRIVPGKFQPRERIDEERLNELVLSIKEKGVVQPIVVRESKEKKGYYEIIVGERRWRASKLAGLSKLPVIIKEIDDKEAIELALIENLQREDLNPIEEAKAYKWLIEKFNYTQQLLAERIGKDRSTIANRIRLLTLPDHIKSMVLNNEITEGHARALLPLGDDSLMIEVANTILKKGLSVRETERLVKEILKGRDKEKRKEKREESPQVKYIIKKLQESLGTKVELRDRKGKGKIVIYYHSYEELDNIIDRIVSKESFEELLKG